MNLPTLEKDTKLDCKELSPEQHFTEPPARFSEASLVKTLEENGIGRPSTYAPTITTIIARGYANKYLKHCTDQCHLIANFQSFFVSFELCSFLICFANFIIE